MGENFTHTTKALVLSRYCPQRIPCLPNSTRSVSLLITFSTCPAVHAFSLSKGMHSGGTTLKRDKVTYWDESVSPESLFGQSLEATQAKFEWRKEHPALHIIIPRRNVKSKQLMGAHKCHPTNNSLEVGSICEFGFLVC